MGLYPRRRCQMVRRSEDSPGTPTHLTSARLQWSLSQGAWYEKPIAEATPY